MRQGGTSMSSPYEIERRIRSLRNTAKVAQAIQMATSDKMRRAQERVQQIRPYSEQLRALMSRLINAAAEDIRDIGPEAALLWHRPVHTIGIMLITPDEDFCGTLPDDINRKAAATAIEEQSRFAEHGKRPTVDYVAVGRKGRDFILRNWLHLIAEFTNYGDGPSLGDSAAIAQVAMDSFLTGEVDVVFLISARFVNTVTQVPIAIQLLPVQPLEEQSAERVAYIYKPDLQTILQELLPLYAEVQVYQALLETVASEQSARIVAMMDVIANANELIHDLTAGL